MQDDVEALFAYDRWANAKVFDASRKLTAAQYVAEPVPGWSSVRSTIYHIALATEFNLRTLAVRARRITTLTRRVKCRARTVGGRATGGVAGLRPVDHVLDRAIIFEGLARPLE